MDATYKQNEMRAYRIMVQLEQILKKEQYIPAGGWRQRLGDMEQQLQAKKFRLAVVGEFNRGKSSFINVLLGKRILPEDVLAATATVNRITYGEKPKAYLIRKDDGLRSREIPVDDLASYVTKLTKSSAQAASGIREAVIEYPTMLCYNDVDLIDTPGMNDMDDMNAVTLSQLENIDLAVVVIHAQYPYSETENRFVVKLLESKMVCQIIFVITHFDRIRDREKHRLYEFLYSRIRKNVLEELTKNYQPGDRIFQKYHMIFDHLHLYGVSSTDAMKALESNDMQLYEKSGFLQLGRELPQVILSSQSVDMVDHVVALLEEMIGEYEAEIRNTGDTWKQMEIILRNCKDLFAGVVRQMDEIAEEELADGLVDESAEKELADESAEKESAAGEIMAGKMMEAEMEAFGCRRVKAGERQGREIVKKLLHALGCVRSLTPDAVQRAMVPVMQQEFEHLNVYYQNRKNQILHAVVQQWRSVLARLASDVKDRIRQCPQLKTGLQTENVKIYKLPYRPFGIEPAGSGSPEASSGPKLFAWSESPVQAVLDTEENQSVLPGLERIVDQSMDACVRRMEDELKHAFAGQIAGVKRELDAYTESLKAYIGWQKSHVRDDTALLAELNELQKECRNLHEKMIQQREKGYEE